MTIPSIRNDTGCLAALWRTAIFLKNAPSCSAVNAMRSSAESCGGIGFFGHSTFVQPQAVVTSIRTSGCSEVLVARRETWRCSAEPHFSQRQYRAFEPQRIVCFRRRGSPSLRSAPMPRGFRPPACCKVSTVRRRRSGVLRRNRPRNSVYHANLFGIGYSGI